MSEHLLNGLLGNVTAKELPFAMASNKAENPLQANLEEESFDAKLAYLVESMSSSNKQAPASVEPEPTLSNQADINLIMEMISKGMLPDIDGLREQLNQVLNNNTNRETVINSGINYASDSKPTPVSTLLHTLLLNSEGTLPPDKPMELNAKDVSSSAKSLNLNNDESVSSFLAKTVKDGEAISFVAKSVGIGEDVSSSAKAMKNGEEVSTLAKAMKNGKEISSLAKAMKDGKAIASVAKTAGGGEEVSLLAKDMNVANDMNSQDLLDNPNNRINGQLASQHANKTVPEESNPNLSLRQDSVQAEVEDSELHHALNASKSQDVTTSFNDNTHPDNDSSDGSINKSTASQDNSFFNNQNSDTAKESNLNPVNNNQGIEPKINFANVSRQINVAKPFESLGVDLVDNFIQRARLFMQGDKSTMRLQLNPPELGSLKLEFTVEDDVMEAKIFVERSAVKDIIEKDIPRLRELIANTEIDVGKLDVFLQGKDDERLGFMDKNHQSDSEDEQAQEFANRERDNSDGEIDEELELNAVNSNSSNRINYFA